ncbi:hypothetical protein G6M85_05905 [Agrobacterium tumefaciens]|uniref:hypothetical protein n=1 Tax=Agrobacterium tumefaciens TaxID=358 RepID=UPI0015744BE7|nr:hypothetical protein [Agrobacterium tumefaciens]NTE65141.1 hypothetical protein [Agrobacterium tumefaciens]
MLFSLLPDRSVGGHCRITLGGGWEASFIASTVAISAASGSSVVQMETSIGDHFEYKTLPFPMLSEVGTLRALGTLAAITTSVANKRRAAWEYVKFLTSAETQTYLTKEIRAVPVSQQTAESKQLLADYYLNHPNRATAIKEMDKISRWYMWPEENCLKLITVVQGYVDTVLGGRASARGIFQNGVCNPSQPYRLQVTIEEKLQKLCASASLCSRNFSLKRLSIHMARVNIVANIASDRLWWLDTPIRSGARIYCSAQEVRPGGSGYFAASAVARSGHSAFLHATVSDQIVDENCLAAAQRAAIDVSNVLRSPSVPPVRTDIFIEPSGERTIIFSGSVGLVAHSLGTVSNDDFVYVNAPKLDQASLERLAQHPKVIAQYSTLPERRYPASVVLGSIGDCPLASLEEIFSDVLSYAGGHFELLVLTNGRQPIAMIDRRGTTIVEFQRIDSIVNATGAGDTFAGYFVGSLASGLFPDCAVLKAIEGAAHFLKEQNLRGL